MESTPFNSRELQPGMRFRDYRLIEEIGSGGQGTVWSALDASGTRVVAIKLAEIPPEDLDQAEDRVFERQAGELMRLRHPGILPMLDVGLVRQTRYQVTPYIPGETLQERLRASPLTSGEALHYAAAIAGALDYLHEQGVIHRDLKPGNVLLGLRGGIYLADFGIARLVSQFTRAMHTGRGTPPYAPPEQHTRSAISPQSDIFGFGILLYELLTGSLPWEGERCLGLELLYSSTELPDPCESAPYLPAGLAPILRRITALDPAQRPSTAGEALRLVCAVFEQPLAGDAQASQAEAFRPDLEAREMLEYAFKYWSPQQNFPALTLSRFVFLETQARIMPVAPERMPFFLSHALRYGWRDDEWWARVSPEIKIDCAALLLSEQDEDVCGRVLPRLLYDQTLHNMAEIPHALGDALLRLALRPANPFLRQESLSVLEVLARPAPGWRENSLGGELDAVLGRLAVDEILGLQAARLIGRLRSRSALDGILRRAAPARQDSLLLQVQVAAGSLPRSIPLRARLEVQADWASNRLIARPAALRDTFILTLLGALLGFGLQIFLSYRLLQFMDAVRFLVALERGLFLGIPFAAGVSLARLLVERLPEVPVTARLPISGLLGGVVVNLGFLLYSVLFLNTFPSGLLQSGVCLLVGLGFAAGSLFRRRWMRAAVAALVMFSALAGSWWAHLAAQASGVLVTPLFFYEYSWGWTQTLITALVGTLLPAVSGAWVDLRA